LERVQAYVAETIRVCTRFHVHDFSMFRNIDDTYLMMEQLANLAAKKFVTIDSSEHIDTNIDLSCLDYCPIVINVRSMLFYQSMPSNDKICLNRSIRYLPFV
jgi:hypothetical protein